MELRPAPPVAQAPRRPNRALLSVLPALCQRQVNVDSRKCSLGATESSAAADLLPGILMRE